MIITPAQLQYIAPGIKPKNLIFADLLTEVMPKYDINTRARVCPFLANLAHESAGFNAVREFASGAAYEGNKVLGNTVAGDGPKYKGRGLMQITGRGMYGLISSLIFHDDRLVQRPELLEIPRNSVESACCFWSDVKKLNAIADMPDTYTHTFNGHTYNRFEWIVLRINGGQSGLKERIAFLQRAWAIIENPA